MRLLAIHSIYSEAGNHPPGSELVLEDKEEAARLVEIGAAAALPELAALPSTASTPAANSIVEGKLVVLNQEKETELPAQKTKKGPNAKT